MKSEAEIEQEARILYEVVHDGLDCLEYFELPLANINGWKRLARMVLIDREAEQGQNVSDAYEIPANLRTKLFIDAWQDWLADRKDRKKPVTTKAAKLQLKKLSAMGSNRAVLAIENSIENGYQGIFEAKSSGNKQKAYESPTEF